MRKTKIVCTIGPATDSADKIGQLIKAGMDVARINFSFGSRDYHSTLIDIIRTSSKRLGKLVAVLQDLAGPKIRVGMISDPITLHRGEVLSLTSEEVGGGEEDKRIPVSHPEILEHLEKGDIIHLADGSIKLKVIESGVGEVTTEVLEGGVLSSYKGVNIPTVSSELEAVTEKDIRDLEFGLKKCVDWIALSFVRSKEDVEKVKEVLERSDNRVPVIAKIERNEAVTNLKGILEVADGIMVARGDLGVEMPLEEIPVVQKKIIKLANAMGKPVITATQMLKSMVVQPHPTRAEVTDVANAVLDGSDAVMLSEETAMGRYPVEAVEMMDRIVRKAETMYPYIIEHTPKNITESIALSAARISKDVGADAIITFTRTGMSALQVSRYRPPVPILTAAHDERTLTKISLIWGCVPLISVPKDVSFEDLVAKAVAEGLKRKILKEGGCIIVTSGFPFGEPGTTNTIQVLKIRDIVREMREA